MDAEVSRILSLWPTESQKRGPRVHSQRIFAGSLKIEGIILHGGEMRACIGGKSFMISEKYKEMRSDTLEPHFAQY